MVELQYTFDLTLLVEGLLYLSGEMYFMFFFNFLFRTCQTAMHQPCCLLAGSNPSSLEYVITCCVVIILTVSMLYCVSLVVVLLCSVANG